MNEGAHESNRDRVSITGGIPEAFAPGQLIASKFKVISMLGSGGMGTVYRVEQIFLKKEFALKTMDHHTGSDVMIQRFQQEAMAAFSLNHPNLVKVHDYGLLDNGNPYLVMDFIDGITFGEYLKKNGPLPIQFVAPLFAQACFGLMAAHEHSVVHRDIKPANLMLLNNVDIDTEGSVKLVDFGIAKLVNREDGEIQALTRTGEIFGSPLYMSPEQCSSGVVDHRSDIYSLGCVLFEMLTGTPPHMGPNAMKTMLLHQAAETPTLKEASLGRDFPESLEHIVAKMLRKYPEQRYQNIGLVAHDLTVFGSENRLTHNVKLPRIKKKTEIVSPKLISMSQTKLYTLLAMTAVFAAFMAGFGVYVIKHEQTKPAPETQAISKPPVANDTNQFANSADLLNFAISKTKANAKQLEQLPSIREVNVTKNYKKQHRYDFPDISLGEIVFYESSGLEKSYKKAQGTVYVPIDQPTDLKIGGSEIFAMLLSPSIFKKIPRTGFQGLIFSIPTDARSTALATEEQQSPEVLETSVATAFQNLENWKNLKKLFVKNCILNEDSLNAFNNFKALQLLTIDQCKLEPAILAKQPFLPKLTGLYIRNCKFDYNLVINQFDSSSSLQSLVVDRPISIKNLHKLQSCPQLTFLQITTNNIDDDAVAEICGMKKLKTLKLLQMVLSAKQIKMLINCKWLNEIQLDKVSVYGDAASRIKTMDPRIKFERE